MLQKKVCRTHVACVRRLRARSLNNAQLKWNFLSFMIATILNIVMMKIVGLSLFAVPSATPRLNLMLPHAPAGGILNKNTQMNKNTQLNKMPYDTLNK